MTLVIILNELNDVIYAGTITAYVTYDITEQGELRLKYSATTDKISPIDLTSHGYFNLAGEGTGTIDDHIITICADHYLDVAEPPLFLIPTGM